MKGDMKDHIKGSQVVQGKLVEMKAGMKDHIKGSMKDTGDVGGHERSHEKEHERGHLSCSCDPRPPFHLHFMLISCSFHDRDMWHQLYF